MAEGTVEERLRALEDVNEIKTLMSLYTRYWDFGIDPEAGDAAERARRFSELFVEDGVWEVPQHGMRAAGRKDIREFLERVFRDHVIDEQGTERPYPGLAIHLAVNPYIQVDGDTAKGLWTGFIAGSLAAREESVWYGSKYHNTFTRTAEGWRFNVISAELAFMTSFTGPGWVREPFVPPRELAAS